MRPFQDNEGALEQFAHQFHLHMPPTSGVADNQRKLEQIVAFLEVIRTETARLSRRRPIVMVDFGAGNCLLGFIAAHYFTHVDPRPFEVHSVEIRPELMDKNRARAAELGYTGMYFHGCDIADFDGPEQVDVVTSLHACDTATDLALAYAVSVRARSILSVQCCQHTLLRTMRGVSVPGAKNQPALRERMVYLAADAMRTQLLGLAGYEAEVIEFVSSRATDKNHMVRARWRNRQATADEYADYAASLAAYGAEPGLGRYLEVARV